MWRIPSGHQVPVSQKPKRVSGSRISNPEASLDMLDPLLSFDNADVLKSNLAATFVLMILKPSFVLGLVFFGTPATAESHVSLGDIGSPPGRTLTYFRARSRFSGPFP